MAPQEITPVPAANAGTGFFYPKRPSCQTGDAFSSIGMFVPFLAYPFNLSGRGDKDLDYIREHYGYGEKYLK